jgi:DNA-binding protein
MLKNGREISIKAYGLFVERAIMMTEIIKTRLAVELC